MERLAPAIGHLRYGVVVLARSDPRLLRATLRSIDRLSRRADKMSVVVPAGREHVFAEITAAFAAGSVRVVGREAGRSPLEQGFMSIAAEADIVLIVPEGVVLDADYLANLADKAGRWDDLVGEIDVVAGAIKLPADAAISDLAELRRRKEGAVPATMRRWLRARSVMASMLWARVAVCGGLRFPHLPEFCNFIAFALFLDRLQCRGRTRVQFTKHASELRLLPERRSGYDTGYALYSRLGRVAAYDDQHDVIPGRRSHLRERLEIARLFGEHALQLVLSPRGKRHVGTFLQGMWAARRDARRQDRKIRHEIGELS